MGHSYGDGDDDGDDDDGDGDDCLQAKSEFSNQSLWLLLPVCYYY